MNLNLPAVQNGANLPANSLPKVIFRQAILEAQRQMEAACKAGRLRSLLDEQELTHYFSPRDTKYGCHTYARAMIIRKGSVAIGKIHRHAHLNFLMKGEVRVNTEYGLEYHKAPHIWVSEPGIKRAVTAIEDVLWVTVHLTAQAGEENLEAIEDELLAKTYAEIGLISSVEELRRLGAKR